MTIPNLLTLPDEEALRDHLDALNEAGHHPVAVGWDKREQPFLMTLVGAYADGEDVLFDSPWQRDIDYGDRVNGEWVPHPPRCNDCQGQAHAMEHLRFPVVVMSTLRRKAVCPDCGLQFDKPSELRDHWDRVHEAEIQQTEGDRR